MFDSSVILLVTLLRGCPARTIDNIRIPNDWQTHIENDRLAIVSPFIDSPIRASERSAEIRNRFVTSLCDAVLIAYAPDDWKTEKFAKELCDAGKTLCTFDDAYTQTLQNIGAKILLLDELIEQYS